MQRGRGGNAVGSWRLRERGGEEPGKGGESNRSPGGASIFGREDELAPDRSAVLDGGGGEGGLGGRKKTKLFPEGTEFNPTKRRAGCLKVVGSFEPQKTAGLEGGRIKALRTKSACGGCSWKRTL